MPTQDRTGPAGYGPRTGRGFGPCGRGFAHRRGWCRGHGWRWRRRPFIEQPMTKEQEAKMLEDEEKILEQEQQELKAEQAETKKRREELRK